MSEVIVTLDAVNKVFKNSTKAALASVSVKLAAGRIIGLVGPDGAGKTTLIRLIAGLIEPTSGHIYVAGLHSIHDFKKIRDIIGYMPQKFGLYEDLTVQENLVLHADLQGLSAENRKAKFEKLLEFTDLTAFTNRLTGKLSGGMKQKLSLACTLLGQPHLLLLDEPGVGVDPISRRELWKMVHQIIAQGISVILSTAYLEEAELCQEVLLINNGELIYSGKPEEMTNCVRGRCFQIRHIAGDRRQLLKRVMQNPDILDGVIQGHNLRIVFRNKEDKFDLQEMLAGSDAELVAVAPRFEDAFIEALGGTTMRESILSPQKQVLNTTKETIIETVELTKKFGDFTATDHVNFKVKRGEIFGLLGPNGAGKSTTFRMLCGLLSPSSGTAEVMGIDLKKSASLARQQFGYMAQKFSLYGNLEVSQNLKFFSGVYGLKAQKQKQIIQEMIDVFKLQDYLTKTPDTLPLGFKQRLALACAIMHQPPILFLDEPTSGVDPVTRREFWMHINALVESGVTVIITTHFMDEAEYCDRIALVFHGKIIAEGTPDQLKQQVATPDKPEPSMEDAFITLIENQSLSAS